MRAALLSQQRGLLSHSSRQMGKGPNMLLSHEDDEGDLEAASSPLLPASKDSALSLRSSRPPSLYHQLKLDYISTIAVLFISVLWICGRVKLAPIQLQHFSNEADPHFPSRIGYAGPTPSEQSSVTL